MKKQKLFLIISLIIIVIYIIILNIPKNYQIDYIINKVKIKEKYNKKQNQYEFIFTYQNQEYPLIIEDKYEIKQKHITNIEIKEDKQDTCLNITYKEKIYYICSDINGLKDYRLINQQLYEATYPTQEENNLEETYETIEIYDKNNIYLIWNYNGYISLNNKNTKIKLFQNEKYTSTNTYQTQNYLIIPNYDTEYYFQKIYIHDIDTNKTKIIQFDYEISYNILYLGTYKNKVYILDLKNKNEYELNFKKSTIKLINEKNNNGLYYNGEKLVTIKVDTLVKNAEKFPEKINKYNYILQDNTLYQEINGYQVKVSNHQITSIITQINDTIYYLVDHTIYSYNYNQGEKKLLKNREWKFNYINQIFIFNKTKK